ncbi:AVAST type 4 anti-phage nuclease Avs4 [Capnocytophaga gingivalis]|uniref:AVAST type 4 anti-phage nuclease Avs4 n=1 Tax=Capnocytophaga gingivalis TaxID=1017 RepID=A0ABU5ZF91_9FLAO|nr:AVAST type 4 anti-phage nuclease Avs4 [Capnocytophaga gingivalis]MEB3076206.1 AVAST type 4 anti-phage nuclease Avs4 [Capnocytophaga gingivalis]
MNWKIFEIKFDKKETWAFEQLSYLLFCEEFNNRIGLFRYKNQTGIETEPIEKGGKYYAFQSKYYTNSISNNKRDIIDSIKKAKSKNNQLNELYLYINQEISESSSKDSKKPKFQLEIEKVAEDEGLTIQWRMPSHFERQLSLPQNKYINELFFNIAPNEGNLIDEISHHNTNILRTIQTEILFEDKHIKIDRSSFIKEIKDTIEKEGNIIISGDGGNGKTAILKEFYNKYYKEIPFCIFKATELNVNHINDIFYLEHKYTFVQFLNAYKDEPCKIFVIDSAEKLVELSNNEILINLIEELKENSWNIIFTTRYVYLNDLTFLLKENYDLPFRVVKVPLISSNKLKLIAKEHNFSLPDNQKFIEILRNPFYLKEYLQQYSNINKQGTYQDFIKLLWKKRIQSTIQKDNLHLERERCIITIAKERAERGHFYINGDNLPQKALFQLKQDEIIEYDDIHNGYFITHDIYEEWALDKIVSTSFSNISTIKNFFNNLGNSLSIRRAFRLWLLNQISTTNNEIENLIQESLISIDINQNWKDEVLISILLSDYASIFFSFSKQKLIANNFEILKRILFLLRVACTNILANRNIEIIEPKGKGWEETIAFIYKNKTNLFSDNLKIILPVLSDWCNFNKIGETTKYAGLLALSIIEESEAKKHFYIEEAALEKILIVVFNAANELKTELKEIFDKVISNKWINYGNPYQRVCSKILKEPLIAFELIKELPLSVIELCDLFWKGKTENHYRAEYYSESLESRYGLAKETEFNYFPASAFQTPIYWLLQKAFKETLDFIIDFTNRAVECYSQTDYGKEEIKKIILHINDRQITQYLSDSVWCMYRGSIGNSPNLLQSMHMALEKALLQCAETFEPLIVQNILLRILTLSKSASLTSVVCSVVLANHNKFYEVALVLFKTIELFHFDSMRSLNESQAKSNYSIGYDLNKKKDMLYGDERLKTCNDEHRRLNLEALFLHYQLFGVNGFNEEQNTLFLERLYQIIDQHKSNSFINQNFGILLFRMDGRNRTLKVLENSGENVKIEFVLKDPPEELKKESEQILTLFEDIFKYSYLRLWSDFKNQNKSLEQDKYDKNPLLALSEVKQLITELDFRKDEMVILDKSIPAFVCSKLLLYHRESLSKYDTDFCKGVILKTIYDLFSDNYEYQVSDGVEASIHVVPILLNEYPEENETYIKILILALFDKTLVGTKRICDYVIETIHNSNLWKENTKIAQSILFNYIKLRLFYIGVSTPNKKKIQRRSLRSSITETLNKKDFNFSSENILVDINSLESLDIDGLEIIMLLIPSDTKEKNHLDIYEKISFLLAPKLLKDSKDYTEDLENETLLKWNIFNTFAKFILNRNIEEIELFLKHFVESLSLTQATVYFIESLIIEEDTLKQNEQFWYVWNRLYPKIQELSKSTQNNHLREVIITFLLAWNKWKEGVKEWHSLKKENLGFYSNISKEIGNIPAVLYSIAKILNSVGSNFTEEGIDCIYNIISDNSSLELKDLESNTIYYLEIFFKKYIFTERKKIKQEVKLKNKIIPILNFMIERGSKYGFSLRESIL